MVSEANVTFKHATPYVHLQMWNFTFIIEKTEKRAPTLNRLLEQVNQCNGYWAGCWCILKGLIRPPGRPGGAAKFPFEELWCIYFLNVIWTTHTVLHPQEQTVPVQKKTKKTVCCFYQKQLPHWRVNGTTSKILYCGLSVKATCLISGLTAPGAAVSWPRALPLDLARARPVIFV